MKNVMCLGFVLMALLSCSRGITDKNIFQGDNVDDGIVGGNVVVSGDPILKHIVHVHQVQSEEKVTETQTNYTFSSCTGVLISPNVVLTAAHCVDGTGRIIVGSGLKKDLDAETIEVYFSAVHKNYVQKLNTSDENFDIAALYIPKAPVGVKPIPISKEEVKTGMPLVATGYGQHNHPGNDLLPVTDELKKVILPADALKGLGPTEFAVFQTMESGIGHGDSGGPIMIERAGGALELVGIVSRAVRFRHGIAGGIMLIDKFNTHSVFSKVSSFLPWIRAQEANFQEMLKTSPSSATGI